MIRYVPNMLKCTIYKPHDTSLCVPYGIPLGYKKAPRSYYRYTARHESHCALSALWSVVGVSVSLFDLTPSAVTSNPGAS